LPADIVNLSAGGCLLVLKEPLPLSQDTIVELTFRINNLDEFRAPGQVKAKRSDTAIGFQFPSLSDTLRQRLQELVGNLVECLPTRSAPSGYREKRRHPRLGCTGPAAVQVVAGEPFIPDTLVELTFNIHHLPFRVRGQVKAIRSDRTIGFQFTVLTDRAKKQLDDLMKELIADIRRRQAERNATTPKMRR
jgi:c-di-GMP-binding flagellar brake protein YcgR